MEIADLIVITNSHLMVLGLEWATEEQLLRRLPVDRLPTKLDGNFRRMLRDIGLRVVAVCGDWDGKGQKAFVFGKS